jgi:MFS transporter, Spinster family, sphingosine-1-phosphate transporter
MLLFGRILSGVGESSFQCCIPPWIATNSDENTKSRWLAIFNTAIPVGTALGYVYSSLVSTSIGWQWAFFLEAVLIFPFLLFLFFIRTRFPHVKAGVRHFKPVNEKDDEEIVPIPQTGDNEVTVRLSLQDDEASIPLFAREEREDKFEQPWEGQAEDPPNLFEEIRIVCQFPCYIYITLGYAAQTGALIGLSTFGSSFLMGLGYFDSEVRPPQIAS